MSLAYESKREDKVELGSDKNFGYTMAGVLALVCFFSVRSEFQPFISIFLSVLSVSFLVVAIFRSKLLRLPKEIWAKFGLQLAKITNPIILGLLFYLVISPIALILKVVGFDPLKRRFDPSLESYWIERGKRPQELQSMENQF